MIYDRIKKICKNKGISVAKLEQDLELGRSSVRRFDQHEPGVGKLNMIAGYLGVTVDALLDDDYYADGEKAVMAQRMYDDPVKKKATAKLPWLFSYSRHNPCIKPWVHNL